MGRISREIFISSPRSRVWRVLEKHLEHPEVSSGSHQAGGIEEVRGEALSEQRSGVGTRTRWFYVYNGKPFAWDDVVTEWDPINRMTWKTTSGWRMEDSFALDEKDGATRLTYDMNYHLPYGPVGRLYGKLILESRMRKHLDQVLRQVKKLSEDPIGGVTASAR